MGPVRFELIRNGEVKQRSSFLPAVSVRFITDFISVIVWGLGIYAPTFTSISAAAAKGNDVSKGEVNP